jgi:hypothetical protein
VFADSRKFAEEWTYRFLATALSDAGSDNPVADGILATEGWVFRMARKAAEGPSVGEKGIFGAH